MLNPTVSLGSFFAQLCSYPFNSTTSLGCFWIRKPVPFVGSLNFEGNVRNLLLICAFPIVRHCVKRVGELKVAVGLSEYSYLLAEEGVFLEFFASKILVRLNEDFKFVDYSFSA